MSPLEEAGLWAHPICDAFDVETLRRLRNECRHYMTGDIKPISPEGQSRWFDLYRDYGPRKIEVWLILKQDGPPQSYPIGFLSLRYFHETTPPGHPFKTWDRGRADGGRNEAIITLGLTESARGQGYGTAIYRYALQVAECPVKAEILKTNEASRRAATKAGYRHHEDMAKTVVLYGDPLGV